MKIKIVSIPVRDQQKALDFYTKVLGFVKKIDMPLGNGDRWLTVVSKDQQDGPELLLEPAPLHFKPSEVYQDAIYESGMPYTQFYVDDVQAEYDRLKALDVRFTMEPTEMGTVKVAVLDDTCHNYIQLVEEL